MPSSFGFVSTKWVEDGNFAAPCLFLLREIGFWGDIGEEGGER